MRSIRVLLADDHNLVRAGIKALLSQIEGITIAAETSNGREALELIPKHHPDLVLMDISMPELNGIEAAKRILADHPQVKIIFLSAHANEEYVMHALRSGASGYMLKDAGTEELELALRSVMRGETYLSPAVSKHVVADYVRRAGGAELVEDPLTPRQKEILQLIAEGKSTKEIAIALKISIKTVETHRTQIMERLDIHDVAGLVRYALRNGLITND